MSDAQRYPFKLFLNRRNYPYFCFWKLSKLDMPNTGLWSYVFTSQCWEYYLFTGKDVNPWTEMLFRQFFNQNFFLKLKNPRTVSFFYLIKIWLELTLKFKQNHSYFIFTWSNFNRQIYSFLFFLLYTVKGTVYSVQCTVYSVQCTGSLLCNSTNLPYTYIWCFK